MSGGGCAGMILIKLLKEGRVAMKKSLPYSSSKADPVKAQIRIRDTLLKFGVGS